VSTKELYTFKMIQKTNAAYHFESVKFFCANPIYKTIILPLVLYGCETWLLTLREKHRLRVFENRVLKKIFGPESGEVTGGWRKLHNEELHNLYSLPDIIDMIKSWN
jgi:hypothetical protein